MRTIENVLRCHKRNSIRTFNSTLKGSLMNRDRVILTFFMIVCLTTFLIAGVGDVYAAGSILTDPSVVDFGRMYVGQTTSPKSITIKNNGTISLTIVSIPKGAPPAQPWAKLSSDGCGANNILKPTEYCKVSYYFEPYAVGSYNTPLNITYTFDGKTMKNVNVQLRGTGIAKTNLYVPPAKGTYGGTVNLSATLTMTPGAAVVSGKVISFNFGGKTLTATTNASGVATVIGVSLTGWNAGKYNTAVQASFVGDQYYDPSSGTGSLDVDKATTTVMLSNLSQTYTGSPLTPTATTIPTDKTIVWTNAPQINAGSYSVTATVNETNYQGSAIDTFTISKAISTTTVTCEAGPFTYDGSAKTPCTATVTGAGLNQTTLTVRYTNNIDAGTATASATYAGDTNHTDSSDSKTFTIDQAKQSITFASLSDKTVDDSDFDVSASASSNLPVSFSSLTPEVCTVSGTKVMLMHIKVGICTIEASQGGDGNYKAAPSVDQSFNVAPGVAVAFSVVASQSGLQISSVTAGDSFDVTVTAKDQYNNTATGYTGTVHFSSNDVKAMLPDDYAFVSGDKGSKTFSAVLKTSVTYMWVKASDSYIEGTTQDINVGPAAANTFLVDTPASAKAGTAFDVKVTVQDAYGNTVTYYTGTVHFTSTDTNSSVILPADYPFTTGDGEDNGVHTFHETTLITAPTQTITITDGSMTVKSANINVMPGALDHFTFADISSPQTALNPFSVTITAADVYENTVTSFTGTLDLTITAGSSISPTTTDNFTGGILTESVTISGAGTGRQITATDSVSGKIGKSNSFDVGKNTATVTLGDLTQTYTGSPLTPTATTSPTDLTIVWDNAPQTNAGSYEVTATVNDTNYQGSAVDTFTISQASSTTTVTCTAGPFTYDGTAKTPCSASVTGAGGLNQTLTTVMYENNINASTADNPATASATYAGDDNHTGSSGSATFTIDRATPIITWANPGNIVCGTPLSRTQLNATATFQGNPVDGSFAYSPPEGIVLEAGPEQPLSFTFTPASGNYNIATATVMIDVWLTFLTSSEDQISGSEIITEYSESTGCPETMYNCPIDLEVCTPCGNSSLIDIGYDQNELQWSGRGADNPGCATTYTVISRVTSGVTSSTIYRCIDGQDYCFACGLNSNTGTANSTGTLPFLTMAQQKIGNVWMCTGSQDESGCFQPYSCPGATDANPCSCSGNEQYWHYPVPFSVVGVSPEDLRWIGQGYDNRGCNAVYIVSAPCIYKCIVSGTNNYCFTYGTGCPH